MVHLPMREEELPNNHLVRRVHRHTLQGCRSRRSPLLRSAPLTRYSSQESPPSGDQQTSVDLLPVALVPQRIPSSATEQSSAH